ncbi:hypothetical protein QTL95_26685 [Rhizobium sp. S152]|uniref:hypothetical protein n=1 Tax=Rhizobium sp. S152 TaxID=3055038 RepID=UPI0025AA2C4F|nr:hypothetical protein [Rhizobium sp. S152]MDM9629476.1 hypothetical protein [Rhizobium sp. S152]
MAFSGLNYEEAMASTRAIKRASERESARKGLRRFQQWLTENSGKLEPCEPIAFISPQGYFGIKFRPDFLVEINGRRTAIHIWNTASKLSKNLVLAALSLVANRYPEDKKRPDNFAVLSLQDGTLFSWSEASKEHGVLGENIVALIERTCDAARQELDLPAIVNPDAPSPTV